MIEKPENLGKLVRVHPIAPAFLQRAVIIAALSFVFFLVTLGMFSMWQNFLYFFLSTGFLIVYLLTMFGWLMSRKNILKIYENGFTYRKFTTHWNEIEALEETNKNGKISCEIRKAKGEKIVLTDSIYEADKAIVIIKTMIGEKV
jgi:hypothetical protein